MSVATTLSKKKRSLFRVKPTPYLLLLPAYALFTMFTFYPFVKSIYLSFFVVNQLGKPMKYVGLYNFQSAFTSPDFWNSTVVTIKFAAMVGMGTFLLAMLLSLMCATPVKHGKIYQIMFSLPMAIASVPVSSLFSFIMNKKGIINSVLGLQIDWFSSQATALPSLALVTIWSSVGSSVIFLIVGFRNVPEDLLECATIDGAGVFTRIFKIMIPIASPQIFFVIFLNIVGSFKSFAIIKLLSGTGPQNSTNTLIYAIYNWAFRRGRFQMACVYSIALFLIIFVITRIQFLLEKRMVHYS